MINKWILPTLLLALFAIVFFCWEKDLQKKDAQIARLEAQKTMISLSAGFKEYWAEHDQFINSLDSLSIIPEDSPYEYGIYLIGPNQTFTLMATADSPGIDDDDTPDVLFIDEQRVFEISKDDLKD